MSEKSGAKRTNWACGRACKTKDYTNFVETTIQLQRIRVMEKINKLDLQILRIVSQNARISIKDIAEECNASRSAVNQRLQRLMLSGVIRDPGYTVNPKAIGYNTCAYVGIRLETGSLYKQVVPQIREIPEVVECHYTTGPYSLLIKLHAIDNQDLMRLLSKIIEDIPGIKETETLISLEANFERGLNLPATKTE